jgi:hypothetical protein
VIGTFLIFLTLGWFGLNALTSCQALAQKGPCLTLA